MMNHLQVKKYRVRATPASGVMTKITFTTPLEHQIRMGNATQRSELTQPQIDQYNNEGFLILEDAISKKRIK